MDQNRYNHLKDETSPYLLQHASNPVDWYPWGDEAFERAKREDKPVFLSIGYSTCHWCHVMAHESFEDEEAAELLNDVFVCIKVDREERPDVDAVYMEAAQALTGSGGWPLNVILTPDRKPFFAATYLPKYSRYGQWGVMELAGEIRRLWTEERERVERASEELTQWICREEDTAAIGGEDREILGQMVEEMNRRFDPQWGGFGRAPKFPMAHMILFLLQYGQARTGGTADGYNAMHMAEVTLEQMYRGGIFDHLGGGFSRYSTDDRWLVPHFEKMLYDNALLALTYAKAWEITEKPLYRRASRETLDYMIRELRQEQGGFFCGQDADSDGEEGKFYIFTREEILKVLGNNRGEAYSEKLGVTARGNWEGKNVLNRRDDRSADKWTERAIEEEDRRLLYEYRQNRCSLHCDDKILTAWNGLALAAFSAGYRAFGADRYRRIAEELAGFMKRELTAESGRLWLRWKDGHAAGDGQLMDYVCYAWGLLELYDVTLDAVWLEEASRLMEMAVDLFEDGEQGGYFMYSKDGEQLISRPKEWYDGAMPSGNSMAALVLVRLKALTGREFWIRASKRQTDWIRNRASGALALLEQSVSSWQMICVSAVDDIGNDREENRTLLELQKQLRRENGHGVLLWKTCENELTLAKISPMTVNYPIPERGTMYYYCREGVCRAPVSSCAELLSMINEEKKNAGR